MKYAYVVSQIERRIFIAIFKVGEETEPTHKMGPHFGRFMHESTLCKRCVLP